MTDPPCLPVPPKTAIVPALFMIPSLYVCHARKPVRGHRFRRVLAVN